MLKIIIIDDEEHAREAISEMLKLYPGKTEIVGMCGSVSQAIDAIKLHKPQVVFLDIEIRHENGFEVLKHFPKPDFKTIFITAYQQYAVEAFRFAALDYLLKPVSPSLLAASLDKAAERIEMENISVKLDSFIYNMNPNSKSSKKIVLKTSDNIHVVELGEILYCEADKNYTSFFLSDNSRIVVSCTMGDYEELFGNYGFLRIHQSYLLNLSYLKRYEKGDGGRAILKTGLSLPVATRKKDQLLQYLSRI